MCAHSLNSSSRLSQWDKRWFVLRGGSTMLEYYKAERDADRGLPPAGSVDVHGSTIERHDTANQRADVIEFVLHTSDRVLGLRTNSEDTFRLWVAAIVAAGGRAPLQKGTLLHSEHGHKGNNVGVSKSGRIQSIAQASGGGSSNPTSPGSPHHPPFHGATRSLSASLDVSDGNLSSMHAQALSGRADSSYSIQLPERSTLTLPPNLDAVSTLDPSRRPPSSEGSIRRRDGCCR